MARTVLLVMMATLLTGCSLLRGGSDGIDIQPPDRPERFEFFMQPGTGTGPHADELATSMGAPARFETGSANHLAQVDTPIGHVDLLTATVEPDDAEMAGMTCLVSVSRSGGSTSCGPDSPEKSASGITGWSSDGMWNETQLYGPNSTVKMVVTVADGTDYVIHTHDGWGLMVWAAVRGEVASVRYLDADEVEFGGEVVIP